MSDFKVKRQEAMSALFKVVYGRSVRQPVNAPVAAAPVSMGATVEAPVCALCQGKEGKHFHVSPFPLMDREGVSSNPVFLSAGIVSAPKCEICNGGMIPHDDMSWECHTEECAARGEPISAHLSGIYPMKPVSESGR